MVKKLKEFNYSSNAYEYLESELANRCHNKDIEDAYQQGDLVIVRRGDVWYTDRCPRYLGKIVKDEMKKYYPELKHLYGESIELKESNETIRKSLSMAITCLEDIVDDIFTLNTRDYSKLIDALEVCKNIKSKLDIGKPISECASLNEADTFGVNVRPNQTKVDELMDEEILSARDVADAAMSWMSDYDVGEMAKANAFFDIFDEE